MRLGCLLAVLFVGCSTRALTSNDGPPPVDASADLARDAAPPEASVDLADPCPAQHPPYGCFSGGGPCTTPNAVCHYGGDTCSCTTDAAGRGFWFCSTDACASLTVGPNRACNVDLTCCTITYLCSCTYVCSSRVWQCSSEGGLDMSTVPGVDMCP